MSTVIFDTDILIWYFRGNSNAAELLAKTPYEDRTVSSLCAMELIQGCQEKKEIRAVREFLRENVPTVIHPDQKISERAMHLLEKHAHSDGLRTIDALIAATALIHDSDLVSGNWKHFKAIHDLNVIRFNAKQE